jgi:hypothetical protein
VIVAPKTSLRIVERSIARAYGQAVERHRIDCQATVAAPDRRLHQSPVSGAEGVFFHVEVTEDDRVLGEALFGDLVRLHVVVAGQAHAIDVIVRELRLGFSDTRPRPRPLAFRPPPELVPFLRRASGSGVLGWREHVVRVGDRLRVRATVELYASRGIVLPESTPLLDVLVGS